jgi:hypothetical protein
MKTQAGDCCSLERRVSAFTAGKEPGMGEEGIGGKGAEDMIFIFRLCLFDNKKIFIQFKDLVRYLSGLFAGHDEIFSMILKRY